MDLNKSKMKNIKAWLELELNFPGVAIVEVPTLQNYYILII